jgi:quercetin dioxygenase-like cupin family protein
MFQKKDNQGYKEALTGVKFKTLVHGEKTLLSEFHLAKGAVIPTHHHPHEQTGYLVSGHLRFVIGEEPLDARPGDSWCIASQLEHSAQSLEDSVVVEVFSPVREEYLP